MPPRRASLAAPAAPTRPDFPSTPPSPPAFSPAPLPSPSPAVLPAIAPLPALPFPLLDPAPPPSAPRPRAADLPSPPSSALPLRAAHPTDLELGALEACTLVPLRAIFYESCLSSPDTEDILQEALFIVWLRWPAIDDAPAFLLGIVRNRIYHYAERRRLDRERRVPFEAELLERLEPAAFTYSPEQRLDSRHDARRFLARLPPRSAAIVALRHGHELPAQDVALRLGGSAVAVRQNARRGLERLRRYARALRSRP